MHHRYTINYCHIYKMARERVFSDMSEWFLEACHQHSPHSKQIYVSATLQRRYGISVITLLQRGFLWFERRLHNVSNNFIQNISTMLKKDITTTLYFNVVLYGLKVVATTLHTNFITNIAAMLYKTLPQRCHNVATTLPQRCL